MIDNIRAGNTPISVYINPNTNMVYVANGNDDTLSLISFSEDQ
jgi:DNA-binding beta-propeller fold protein YncE